MFKFFILAFVVCFVNGQQQEQAPWQECGAEDLPSPIQSTNVQVFVDGCHRSTDNVCTLTRGTNRSITIKFTPTSSSSKVQRLIIARFPKKIKGKHVEVPYGGIIDPCPATRKDDGLTCENNGLSENVQYTHDASFPVIANAPKTKLEVRYMIRADVGSKGRKNDWRSHEGPYYVCTVIPVQID